MTETTQTTEIPDYMQTYNDTYKGIVENPDGTLNLDKVARELHDYLWLMGAVGETYDAVTLGRISKPNTMPVHIIDAVDERIQEAEERGRAEGCTESAEHANAGS